MVEDLEQGSIARAALSAIEQLTLESVSLGSNSGLVALRNPYEEQEGKEGELWSSYFIATRHAGRFDPYRVGRPSASICRRISLAVLPPTRWQAGGVPGCAKLKRWCRASHTQTRGQRFAQRPFRGGPSARRFVTCARRRSARGLGSRAATAKFISRQSAFTVGGLAEQKLSTARSSMPI
jgi:hypothetical protein